MWAQSCHRGSCAVALVISGLSWQLSLGLEGGGVAISGFYLQLTLASRKGAVGLRLILVAPFLA